jgi:hypothetical protein
MTTDPTAQPTPTPAPVAVPDRQAFRLRVRAHLLDRLADEFPGIPFEERVALAESSANELLWAAQDYSERHAPREDALRPESVTASDHHVFGAENFNELLDDVLADPEAREAFEKAQGDPVTALLPSEATLMDALGRLDDMPGWWGGTEFRRAARQLAAGLAAGYTLPAADQRARNEGPARLRIENGWLVREVDEHTCNGGVAASSGAHEPNCGLIPELDLSTLPGWPGSRDEGTVREEIARQIEATDIRKMLDVVEAWEQAARIARGGTR